MIKINEKVIYPMFFPDGTQKINFMDSEDCDDFVIEWHYENEVELITLYYLIKHIRTHFENEHIYLFMPYVPNARMDRVKNDEEVFTLKYFCDFINSLNLSTVEITDPHSNVVSALLNNCIVSWPIPIVECILSELPKDTILFFPDAGASKRYADMFPEYKYIYGNKKREWETGKILGTEIVNPFDVDLTNKTILIIDDICSRGTTFLKSAEALQPYGVGDIYLYISHCENTIFEGELLTTDLIKKIYTTNSIFTKEHEKIEVFKL